jgi:hypothetical protein
MSDVALPRATIAALRARHVAFLAERLTSEAARGDWVRSFEAGYEHVLSLPIRQLMHPAALVSGLEKVLSAEAVRGFAAPVARDLHRRVLGALRDEPTPLGDYVPDDARASIDALLARSDLLPEALVRRIFDQEATEDVLRDVLYDALKEFNDTVNPFFAEWGLPGLLKRFMPIGSGTVLKSLAAVRGEFDKRLEPEMRKFLLVFSRKAKGKIADFVVERGSDPKSVELRKAIVAFFYEQAIADLVSTVDDAATGHVDAATEAVVLRVLERERPRERLRAELERFVEQNGDRTVGAWLADVGVTARPDLEALAELTWPLLSLALSSPPGRAFVERLTWDFYATIPVAE